MLNKSLLILICIISIFISHNVKAVGDDEWSELYYNMNNSPENNTIENNNEDIGTTENNNIQVGNSEIKNSLLGTTKDSIIKESSGNGVTTLQNIIIWVKDTLTGFLLLVAIGVFLYIGIKIAFARGNPEEFSKAWMHLVYAVIGIFVISLAWAAVTLVSGLSI